MNVRFHTDPDGELHIHAHGVAESEVLEALAQPLEQFASRDESTALIGRTRAGRVLKIIFSDTRDGDGIFIITAFELPPKQLRALKQRPQAQTPMKPKHTPRRKPASRPDSSPYPKGWDRKRVEALIEHYDNQSDDDAIAEAEDAYANNATAMIQVPLKLVPQVQKLLAKRAG